MHRIPWKTSCCVLLLAQCLFGVVAIPNPCTPRSSSVSTQVTGSGPYTYDFTVANTSVCDPVQHTVWPVIVDFELPLALPADIYNIQSPIGWNYEILSASGYLADFGFANPFGSPYVIHWYDSVFFDQSTAAKMIVPAGFIAWSLNSDVYQPSTSGFIFQSHLGPVDGPYMTSWADSARNIGDPPLPGDFDFGAGGLPAPYSPAAVPEPSAGLLFAAGLASLTVCRRLLRR